MHIGLAIILGMDSANERSYVMPPPIGRAHTQNGPWLLVWSGCKVIGMT